MSATIIGLSAIAKAASPIIKDIYDGAKGTVQRSLDRWTATGFSKKIARQLSDIDSVRTIWSPEKNVSLRSFYYPSRLRSAEERSTVLESITDLGEGCIVIQGIVGQGKSILLRYLALQEILRKDNRRLPIFLELRKVTKSTPLIASIHKALSAYDVNVDDALFEYLAASGKIVVLLDGFDELETPLVRQATLDLEHLAQKFPELQIIVTSRPNNEVQKLNSFRVLEVAPLHAADYPPFLQALGLEPVKIVDIVHAIQSSPSQVAGLIVTPLMLTLVVFVYQSEKQIPADLPEFFDRLFYTVFTRHDKLKAAFEREHHSGLSERKLQALFEAFCFMSLQLGTSRTLSPAQFNEAFELAQDYLEGSACKESAFRKDITKVACLMLEEGVGDATFLHKSIAEYHAAAFVKSSDDAFAKRFYEEATVSWVHWQECLGFLQSIDPYRFSKYFAINNLRLAISLFEELAACKSGIQLQTMMPSWMSKTYVAYRASPDKAGTFKRSSFGSWQEADNFYARELSDVLSTAAFLTGPEILTESEVSELRAEEMQISAHLNNEIEFAFPKFLDRWGIDKCQRSLADHIYKLKEKLKEAEVHANKLNSRPMIFDRKRKS
ncbi:NACHT domain-containing protein [Undibacterium aquatile]|uniref:NACHT domain-containing protein n=1 Tax=Undibacterium aquatile TaxID=1537398 RepID=A0ABR6XHM6_9BURK|nr:NACHT domain-containing protein [Undibacterium aquatile]MBC3812277.1 NACHT domain-containing protein [Undibacterium aquatile]